MTPQSLLFRDENDSGITLLKIKWPRLEKITANVHNVANSATAMLKLTRTDGRNHIFKFLAGRPDLEEARSDIKSRWKLAQDQSLRDFEDEDLTDGDCSQSDNLHGLAVLKAAAEQEPVQEPSAQKLNKVDSERHPLTEPFREAAHRRASASHLYEKEHNEDRRDSSTTTNQKNDEPKTQATKPNGKKSSHASQHRSSIDSSTLSLSSSEDGPRNEGNHMLDPAVRQSTDGTSEYGAYVHPSHSHATSHASTVMYPHPYPYHSHHHSDASAIPPIGSSSLPGMYQPYHGPSPNLTLVSNDRIIIHDKDQSPQCILDFSMFHETQQIRVCSIKKRDEEEEEMSLSRSSRCDHSHHSHKIRLIKSVGDTTDVNDVESQQRQHYPIENTINEMVIAEDFKYFGIAGCQWSKKTCFVTVVISLCCALILMIVAVILLIVLLIYQNNNNNDTGSAIDDFNTRYQQNDNISGRLLR